MAGGNQCMFTGDYSSGTSFFAQVRNTTNSIYSNLYLDFPIITPGIAYLTPILPNRSFFLDGTILQGCDRATNLVKIQNNDEFGAQIIPNAAGRAAVTVLEHSGSNTFWTSLTAAFYLTSTLEPLNLWVPNAGGYYACTDGLGDINVYYRLNTTTTPLGCQDILLDIKLHRD